MIVLLLEVEDDSVAGEVESGVDTAAAAASLVDNEVGDEDEYEVVGVVGVARFVEPLNVVRALGTLVQRTPPIVVMLKPAGRFALVDMMIEREGRARLLSRKEAYI